MTALFVEHLTVIDCAYLDLARGLVGESWIVDVELEGDLDAQSMVLDFGEVKRSLKRTIDAGLDHTLLVPREAPELSLAHSSGGSGAIAELLFRSELGAIEHRSPTCAVTLLPTAMIDEGSVAASLEAQLAPTLPDNVCRCRVSLRAESIHGAYYHYVHGLKKHEGQCQRIAHGHRSRLEIRIDGARDPGIEQDIALAWTDIYIGTREDLVARANGRVRFAYQAPEGRFELALPEQQIDLLDTDSTVERIAEHLAAVARARRPGARVEVRAYEGVMKGAVARLAA
ncbi:MAG: 6-carboxytetrahydropterin synthase [Panacagrimonas sp.]